MEDAKTAQDQEEYSRCYEGYAAKHEKLKKLCGDAHAEREARQNKAQILDGMIESLRCVEPTDIDFVEKL